MSAVLPAALALISLSSSYLFYNATQDQLEPQDPSVNLPPAPTPWAYVTDLASPTDDDETSVSDVDFDKETFTFKLPPVFKKVTNTSFVTLHKNPFSIMPSDAELAGDALNEESLLRFPSFKMEDAVVLGMNLRKRFRASCAFTLCPCVVTILTGRSYASTSRQRERMRHFYSDNARRYHVCVCRWRGFRRELGLVVACRRNDQGCSSDWSL